jgi:hypothetical protein
MKFFLSISFLFLMMLCQAQSYLGVQGGFVRTYYRGDSDPHSMLDVVSKGELAFDVFLRERKNDYFNFTWGLSYLQRSFEGAGHYTLGVTQNYVAFEGTSQSIGLEILPEINFGKKIDFYVHGGLRIGGVISSSHQAHGYDTYWVPPDTVDYVYWQDDSPQKNQLRSLDVGFKTGMGIHVPLGKKLAMNINGQYTFGLNNLAKEILGLWQPMKSSHWSLQIGFSYLLSDFSLSKYVVPQPVPVE